MADPYCLAMLLCDHVHRDPATGKCTILGTFTTLGAASFPCPIAFVVYFSITDGIGETDIRLRLVDSEDTASDSGHDLISISTKCILESPLVVIEAIHPVAAMIPKEGVYHCELYAGDSLLMSRRLVAMKLGQDKPSEPTDE